MSRNFLQKNSVPGFLNCFICREVFTNPVRLSCKHTFCRDCIEKWHQKKSGCAICKKKFGKKSIAVDLIASYLVNDLEVICRNEGCEWNGRLELAESHENQCLGYLRYADKRSEEDEEQSLLKDLDEKYPQKVGKEYKRQKVSELLLDAESLQG